MKINVWTCSGHRSKPRVHLHLLQCRVSQSPRIVRPNRAMRTPGPTLVRLRDQTDRFPVRTHRCFSSSRKAKLPCGSNLLWPIISPSSSKPKLSLDVGFGTIHLCRYRPGFFPHRPANRAWLACAVSRRPTVCPSAKKMPILLLDEEAALGSKSFLYWTNDTILRGWQ